LIKELDIELKTTIYYLDINDDYTLNPVSEPKLFLVERDADDYISYDEYESILVACETPEQAKSVMSSYVYRKGASLDKLVITKLSDNYTKIIYRPEVPIASFNAI